MADFSVRFRQLTQRLLDQTQIKEIFNEPEVSESQGIARQLAEAGERVTQLSQVVAEAEVLSQLHNSLVNECESLRMEKSNLESFVLDLHQERNEIEPQVMYFRDELAQAQGRLEEVQTRERNLSDRERQLTDIVAQLERRRAVLNQTIENLTNQEADFIVRTQELSKAIETREEQATQMMQTVSHFTVSLDELLTQVDEKRAELKALGTDPDEVLREKLQEAKELLRDVEATQDPPPRNQFSGDRYPNDPYTQADPYTQNGGYPPNAYDSGYGDRPDYNQGYLEQDYGRDYSQQGYANAGYSPYNPEPAPSPAGYEQAPYDNAAYASADYSNDSYADGNSVSYGNSQPAPSGENAGYGEFATATNYSAGSNNPGSYNSGNYDSGNYNSGEYDSTGSFDGQNNTYTNQAYGSSTRYPNEEYADSDNSSPQYGGQSFDSQSVESQSFETQDPSNQSVEAYPANGYAGGNPSPSFDGTGAGVSSEPPFPAPYSDDPWMDTPPEPPAPPEDKEDQEPEPFSSSPFNDNPWG
ncbi:MAG: hypothetical protein AAGJ55_00335 [Cyanobacteria bacterium J06555_12]